jgi:predicted aspartyl protease
LIVVPHFTLQLTSDGPIVSAHIGVSDPRRAALTAAQQTIPPWVPIRALIDTGASCTCLDPSVVATLGIPATGSVSLNTPSTGTTPHSANQYDVALVIPAAQGQTPLVFATIPVVATELLAAQAIHALIGRDILRRCVFYYNGSIGDAGLFTLAY